MIHPEGVASLLPPGEKVRSWQHTESLEAKAVTQEPLPRGHPGTTPQGGRSPRSHVTPKFLRGPVTSTITMQRDSVFQSVDIFKGNHLK